MKEMFFVSLAVFDAGPLLSSRSELLSYPLFTPSDLNSDESGFFFAWRKRPRKGVISKSDLLWSSRGLQDVRYQSEDVVWKLPRTPFEVLADVGWHLEVVTNFSLSSCRLPRGVLERCGTL